VLVETQAGAQSGFPDAEYQNAGAEIVGDAGFVWSKSEVVVKVKEPIETEYRFFREGLVLFTYLHLAPLPALTDKLLESKVIGIAYETVRDQQGTLPLLTPMSEVAGRMSVQVGASYLEKERGGRGILLAASQACRRRMSRFLAAGLWAPMRPASRSASAPESPSSTSTEPAARARRHLRRAPLHAGLEQLQHRPGHPRSGSGDRRSADSRRYGSQTHHALHGVPDEEGRRDRGCGHRPGRLRGDGAAHLAFRPSYLVDGVVHYCVTNMPGAVPHTSTLALTNSTSLICCGWPTWALARRSGRMQDWLKG